MKRIIPRFCWLAAIGCAALLAAGCKTVVRENIIASVETGVGITLAENPKTEIYEAKVGFIRSQFYSIPTGKVVENDGNAGTLTAEPTGANGAGKLAADTRSNRADITPEVVSGIRVNTGIQHLFLGADISENFAVGKEAVGSQAAIAMYIADAKTDKAATEAAKAVNPVAMERAKIIIQKQNLAADEVIAKIYSADGQINPDQLKKAIQGTALEDQFESISKLSKAMFLKRLTTNWSDLAIEMKDNLNQ